MLGEHSSVLRCQPYFAILTARQALFSLRSWGNGSGGAKYEHSLYCDSTDSNHTSLWKITLRVTSAEIPLRGLWLISYKHNWQNCGFPKKPKLKRQEHEQIEAPAETAAVGREPLQDEVSVVPGRALSSVSGTWRGGEELAELQTSAHGDLGPLNLAGRWGLGQREGWHPEILDTEILWPWRQKSYQLINYHSIVFKQVWTNFQLHPTCFHFLSHFLNTLRAQFLLLSSFTIFWQFTFFTLYTEKETIKLGML